MRHQSNDKRSPLLQATRRGLDCAVGGFTIDPYRAADIAVITHAHADHARRVATQYIAAKSSVPLLRKRLGDDINLRGIEFGQPFSLGGVRVSLHPAGHVLGSAQVRVEYQGEVWVFTGDFKRDDDPSCEPFELVPCDTFITEATFALPIYRWQPGHEVAGEIWRWWQSMQQARRPAVLFCYALGKAQRVLSELTAFTDKPVFVHGAVEPLTDIYRDAGVRMLATIPVDLRDKKKKYEGELIIAPPGASGSTWMRQFPHAATGFCSGWMRVRGNRRRRGYDRGFVLSDHADWSGLLQTIQETGARQVYTTHGQASALIRLLVEKGIDAQELETQYGVEEDVDASETAVTDS